MLLSGWAKLKNNHALFNGELVSSVEIAIGKNDAGESVKFFVISKAGDMFSTEALGMYEIHKLHDLPCDSDKHIEARKWIVENIDSAELSQLVTWEKENYFSMYERADSCKRVAVIEFEDKSLNYKIGLKEFVTYQMLSDFYVSNSFQRGVDEESHECIGVTIFNK